VPATPPRAINLHVQRSLVSPHASGHTRAGPCVGKSLEKAVNSVTKRFPAIDLNRRSGKSGQSRHGLLNAAYAITVSAHYVPLPRPPQKQTWTHLFITEAKSYVYTERA
jgi:hypothetical protein